MLNWKRWGRPPILQDDAGDLIYYPNGVFGKGYVIESETKKDEIESFAGKQILFMLLGIGFLSVFGVILASLLTFLLLAPWYWWTLRTLKKDMKETTQEFSFTERFKRLMAQKYNERQPFRTTDESR